MTLLKSKINAIVDERLFKAYWDAVKHFKSKDLVLYYDENEDVDPVKAHIRSNLISARDIPEDLKNKLSKSAAESAINLKKNDGAFWLIVACRSGELAHVAINTTFITQIGNA